MNQQDDPQQVESADHVFSYPPQEVTAAADAALAALQQVSPLDDAQLAGNTGLDPTRSSSRRRVSSRTGASE